MLYSLIWYPILSHLVSYQPRLFIAKCCCQQRWRPPACWRWMWMWHKILMSEVAPSTAHQTLLYQPSLRRTFSAPGPGMVLFSVPYGMPGNGSAIIHAHSSSRLIISGVSLIHQRYLHNTHRSEFFRSRLPVQKKVAGPAPDLRLKLAIPDIFTTSHFPPEVPLCLKCILVL